MKPVATPECNFVYKLPGGTEKNDLPCLRDDESVTSFWQLYDDEADDLRSPWIVVYLWAARPLDLSLRVGDGVEHKGDDLDVSETTDGGEHCFMFTALLSEREAQAVRDGTLVRLMVPQTPPPPVSVEVA